MRLTLLLVLLALAAPCFCKPGLEGDAQEKAQMKRLVDKLVDEIAEDLHDRNLADDEMENEDDKRDFDDEVEVEEDVEEVYEKEREFDQFSDEEDEDFEDEDEKREFDDEGIDEELFAEGREYDPGTEVDFDEELDEREITALLDDVDMEGEDELHEFERMEGQITETAATTTNLKIATPTAKVPMVKAVALGNSSMASLAVSKLAVFPWWRILRPIRRPYYNPCQSNQCCDNRVAYFDLNRGYYRSRTVQQPLVPYGPEGIFLQSYRPPRARVPCGTRVQIKINFDRLTRKPCHSCLNEPFFGRTMLKVELFLHRYRGRHMFGVGDSRTNNGYGGDGNTNRYDSEVDGIYPHTYMWSNDICKREQSAPNLWKRFLTTLRQPVTKVTLYVANNYFRIVAGRFDESICSKCAWNLNGMPDTNPNQDIYLSLNTAINFNNFRWGWGVCYAKLSWLCKE